MAIVRAITMAAMLLACGKQRQKQWQQQQASGWSEERSSMTMERPTCRKYRELQVAVHGLLFCEIGVSAPQNRQNFPACRRSFEGPVGGTLGPSPKSATLAVTIIPVSPTGGVATPGTARLRTSDRRTTGSSGEVQKNGRQRHFCEIVHSALHSS